MEGSSAVPRRLTPEELLQDASWVRLVARALVSDPHLADDVEQDAWVTALQNPPVEGEGIRAWWMRVIRSRAFDRGRRTRRRERHEKSVSSTRPEAILDDPLDTAQTLEAHQLLMEVLKPLEEPYRAYIVARYLQGLTIVEIARAAQVTESTVRARIEKGLERMRRDLDARTPGGRSAWNALLVPLAAEIGPRGGVTVGVGLGAWIAAAAGMIALVTGLAFVLADANRLAPEARGSAPEAVGRLDIESAPHVPAEGTSRRAVDAPIAESVPTTATMPATSTRIELRCVDAFDRPVPHAEVIGLDRVDSGEIAIAAAPRAHANRDGRVVLELAAGDRSMRRARAAGQQTDSAIHVIEIRGEGLRSHRIPVLTRDGAVTDLGDVRLAPGTRVSGRVLDDSGRLLAGARVRLLPADVSAEERAAATVGAFARRGGRDSVESDAAGRFEFDGAPIGTWIVAASVSGRATAISAPFELAPGVPHVLEDLACAAHPHVVSGIVLLPSGTSPLCVTVYRETTTRGSETWLSDGLDDEGRFTLSVDGPGPFTIAASTTSGTALSGRLDGVMAGSSEVRLHLDVPPTIEVTARDAAGATLSDFLVGVRTESGDRRLARTKGPAGVVNAPPIPFHVLVDADGFGERAIGPYTDATAPARLDVVLDRAALVRGRVVDAGSPVRHARVRAATALAQPEPGPDGFPVLLGPELASARTDDDGAFALELPGGGPFVVWTIAGPARVESAPFRALDGAIVLDVARSGSVTGRVRFPPAGTLEDARDVVVRFANGAGELGSVRVEADGRFDLGRLAPGPWTLVPDLWRADGLDLARAASYEEHPLARRIAVAVGVATEVDLEFDPRAARGVEGRLALAGAPRRTWIASLRHADEPERDRRSVEVGRDGSFFAPAAAPGENVLVLRAVESAGRDTWIEARVELAHAPLGWRFERTTGTLSVDGPAGAERVLTADLSAELGAGGTWTTRFLLDAAGRARLEGLPSGPVRIADPRGDRAAIELAVPAIGSAHASLP